jgi:hypothetical protein
MNTLRINKSSQRHFLRLVCSAMALTNFASSIFSAAILKNRISMALQFLVLRSLWSEAACCCFYRKPLKNRHVWLFSKAAASCRIPKARALVGIKPWCAVL